MNYEICECCGKPKKKKTWADRFHDGGTRSDTYREEDEKFGQGTKGNMVELPATPLAQAFAGHRYGLQALKPALEPIIVFQKPYAGRPIDCITRTGAGVLNVDGGRIGFDAEGYTKGGCKDKNKREGYGYKEAFPTEQHPQGRWPANFYLGDPEAARRLDAQSGELPSDKKRYARNKEMGNNIYSKGMGHRPAGTIPNEYIGDTGGASRFFLNVREQIDDADPVRYVAKASRRERDAGLDGMPLVNGVVQDGSGRRFNPICENTNKRAQDCDCGACVRSQVNPLVRNPHPTVKPLALTRYLATLLLPPAEYAPRRLFVPFSGVGSESIGASQAGWEFVQGVEITEEYLPIAQARAEYWTAKEKQLELI